MARHNHTLNNEEELRLLKDRVNELERTLTAKEKIVSVLMNRVERSIDTTGSAFSIFERNILLENLVAQRTRELQEAMNQIKRLSGLLPICSYCKCIRDDKGYWQEVGDYIHKHSEAEFTHSLCPKCLRKFYPDLAEKLESGISDSQ